MSSLLPPNATAAERAMAETEARISDTPVPIEPIWDPETCPVELLPWLAWGLSADLWNPEWSEVLKRTIVANSMDLHRRKGTRGAIEDMLQAIIGVGEVTEWFEYGGDPYWFRVEIDLTETTLSFVDLVVAERIVAVCKNARSHCEPIRFLAPTESWNHVLAVTIFGDTITVYPEE